MPSSRWSDRGRGGVPRRAGTLVSLPLDQPEIQSSAVHAVYLPDRRPPAKVRAFIDFLAARFSPDPPWDRGLF